MSFNNLKLNGYNLKLNSSYTRLGRGEDERFITVWDTTQAGISNSDQIKLPLESNGNFNFTVYWGDDTSDVITTWNQSEITHTYPAEGEYTVMIVGIIDGFGFDAGNDKLKLKKIIQFGKMAITDNDTFNGCPLVLGDSFVGVPTITTNDLSNAFRNADNFNHDVNKWDMSNVERIQSFFRECNIFNQPINTWNVSSVTNCSFMFKSALQFNQPLNDWDVSNVISFNSTFRLAAMFNQPLNDWDVSNVTDFNSMFRQAEMFNQPLNDWDVSNVTNFSNMFRDADSFNQPLNDWAVYHVTNFNSMFYSNRIFNQPLNDWDTSSAIKMNGMFRNADSFNQPIGNWDTSKVKTMLLMFRGNNVFNQPLSGWNTSRVTNMSEMFRQSKFDQDIGNWNISSLTDATDMFSESTLSTENYDSLLNGWAAQAPNINNNVLFHGGFSTYTGAASASRAILTDTYNWTITDGGIV